MSAVAHLHGVTGWPGKPTSGRYVYKSRGSGAWFWQCDLHNPELLSDQYGQAPTMQEAFKDAHAHALVCSARYPEEGASRPDRSEETR